MKKNEFRDKVVGDYRSLIGHRKGNYMGICETRCKAGISGQRNGAISRDKKRSRSLCCKALIIQCDVADAQQCEPAADDFPK